MNRTINTPTFTSTAVFDTLILHFGLLSPEINCSELKVAGERLRSSQRSSKPTPVIYHTLSLIGVMLAAKTKIYIRVDLLDSIAMMSLLLKTWVSLAIGG